MSKLLGAIKNGNLKSFVTYFCYYTFRCQHFILFYFILDFIVSRAFLGSQQNLEIAIYLPLLHMYLQHPQSPIINIPKQNDI